MEVKTNSKEPPLLLSVEQSGAIRLGTLDLFCGDLTELQSELSALLRQGGVHLVVTANVDQVLDLKGSSVLTEAYHIASLRTLDGMPLVALAQGLGAHKPTRHTGADLLFRAVEWSASQKWKIAVAGGDSLATARAVEALGSENPGASIVGIDFPYITTADAPESSQVVEHLNEVQPNITFLCLGSPKQEGWFLQWRHLLPPGVYIGAGAAVDFAAGSKSRAPVWVQKSGFEWVWRLVQEPRRLAYRYLIKGPRFLGFISASILRKNK